jgi:hypothetical protein
LNDLDGVLYEILLGLKVKVFKLNDFSSGPGGGEGVKLFRSEELFFDLKRESD